MCLSWCIYKAAQIRNCAGGVKKLEQTKIQNGKKKKCEEGINNNSSCLNCEEKRQPRDEIRVSFDVKKTCYGKHAVRSMLLCR